MAIARGDTTILPLYTFAKIIGYNPLHFCGVLHPTLETQTDGNMIMQENWQNADSSSREEIAHIISDVESQMIEYLRYTPAPVYTINEKFEYPRPRNPELFTTWGYDIRGMWRRIQATVGYTIQGGTETLTLAQAGASVVYTDTDGDTYKETATIGPVNLPVFPIPMSDPSQVSIFYPGHLGDEHYEIRPTKVTINTTTNQATILCRREQLVKEVLLFGYPIPIVQGGDDSSFLTTVDVYRHWPDPGNMCTFQWDNLFSAGQYLTQPGVMLNEDPTGGFFSAQPGVYDPTTQSWSQAWWSQLRMPDRAVISYLGGYPLDPATNQMDTIWQRAIAFMTLARLDRQLEGQNAIKEFTNYWADDRGMNSTDRVMLTSRRKLDNPFGTSRGEIYAWERVSRRSLGQKLEMNSQV